MASVPPCPRGWVASGPPLRFRRPQCRPSAATGGPISSLVGGWPQCLPSAAQAPPYPPSTRGPQAFSGATAHSRAAAKHTYRSHLPARPCAPFFLPCLPPLPPAPTPRPVFLSCGWMAQCLISGHSGPPYPLSPRLPMSPAPCRHKAPPLGGQADDRAPLPNKAARPHRTPALFNSSHLRGRALPSTPPPLHPRFWHWTPSSLARCCLLSSPARGRPPPGEESPRSNPPTDGQGARFSPYLSATTPPEGFSDYTVVTDRDCAGK